jgi:NAD(P)-dependent dehydrogenase (short-subunit alcohol dehydrogenase family)
VTTPALPSACQQITFFCLSYGKGVFMNQPVAIITGGAQGIGRATALYLQQKNFQVVVADIETLEQPGITFIKADASSEADLKHLIETTLKTHGQIDALVNNVGVGINKPLSELTLEAWNHVLAVNLTSIFLTTKYAEPYLRAVKGAVVNIASTRAMMSEANTEAYSASKGGVVALTHALSISLGPDVRVNCVSPGWIETGEWQKEKRAVTHSEADKSQHPVGRVGQPKDIAAMIYYLLSEESGFITGQNFVIDGGMTKKMIYV